MGKREATRNCCLGNEEVYFLHWDLRSNGKVFGPKTSLNCSGLSEVLKQGTWSLPQSESESDVVRACAHRLGLEGGWRKA
eukprot:5221292-Amphidinium_carterae.1